MELFLFSGGVVISEVPGSGQIKEKLAGRFFYYFEKTIAQRLL